MRISDWSSDVCSSDLLRHLGGNQFEPALGSKRDELLDHAEHGWTGHDYLHLHSTLENSGSGPRSHDQVDPTENILVEGFHVAQKLPVPFCMHWVGEQGIEVGGSERYAFRRWEERGEGKGGG